MRFKRGPPPVMRTEYLDRTSSAEQQASLVNSAGKVLVAASPSSTTASKAAGYDSPRSSVDDWEDAPAFVQRAGRVAWRVFFSAYAAAAQQNLDLTWYRVLILRLHAHLCVVNPHAAEALRVWIDKRRVRLLPNDLANTCPLAPEICTYCASRALGLRGDPGTLMPPEQAPALGLTQSIAIPTLELHLTASNMCHAEGVFSVNSAFVDSFGLTAQELDGVVSWTGASGMLPWGCDVFTALFVSEMDVALLLHAVASKFYSAAEEAPGVRSVLVASMARVRLRNNRVAQCLVRAWYRETRDRLACTASMEGVVTFDPVIVEKAVSPLPPLPAAWETAMVNVGAAGLDMGELDSSISEDRDQELLLFDDVGFLSELLTNVDDELRF
jgi:hypothetical protein